MDVRLDAARSYGLTRVVRGGLGLLGGIITTLSAFTGMCCVIALAIGIVGVGTSSSSDSEADTSR